MTESVVLEGGAARAVAPPPTGSGAVCAPVLEAPPRSRVTATASTTLAIAAAAGPSATVAALAGELDRSTAPTLVGLLDELAAEGVAHLVLDLRRLYYVDARGVLLLLDAHRVQLERGARLSLVGVRPRVADILRRAGADRLLPLFRTLDEAVEPDEARPGEPCP